MKDGIKAWTGVILIFLVAAGAFWFANKPIRELDELENQSLASTYERPIPRNAHTDPQYVMNFYHALERGNAKAVEQAIADHPDLPMRRFGNETALHVAARCNQPQLIDLLLEHNPDLDARGQWGGTALHWACWFGSKAGPPSA